MVRMIATFFAIMLPLYAAGFLMYSWGLKTAREEIEKSAAAQAAFYLQGLEKEIERIRLLQFDCLNDDNLDRLVYRSEVMGTYERLERVGLLRTRLYSIQNSSQYIRDVRVYLLPLNRMLSSTSGYDLMDEQAYLNHRVPAGKTGAQIFQRDEAVLMSTLRAEAWLNTSPLVMVEVELEPGTLQAALRQFMTFPGSGACLLDIKTGTLLGVSAEAGDEAFAEQVARRAFSPDTDTSEFQPVRYEQLDGKKVVLVQADSSYLGMRLVRYIPAEHVTAPLQTFRFWMWGFALVAIAVIAAFSLFAWRAMQKPVQELVDAFRKVETGDLDAVISHDARNEFGYLYRRFNDMVRNLRMLIDQSYRQRMLVQRAELKQLQSQINPHFLYNSFFILNTMARVGDTKPLLVFTKQLGDYFRFIARNAADVIPLHLEVRHARLYTEIQAMRFSRRLRVEFGELPVQAAAWDVPRLILQPVIENAFQHGLERKEQGGLLRVTFSWAVPREGDAVPGQQSPLGEVASGQQSPPGEVASGQQSPQGVLLVMIEDNGTEVGDDTLEALRQQIGAQDAGQEITGLMNIHRRLQLFYGPTGGLRLRRGALGGLQVTLEIPGKGAGTDVQTADL